MPPAHTRVILSPAFGDEESLRLPPRQTRCPALPPLCTAVADRVLDPAEARLRPQKPSRQPGCGSDDKPEFGLSWGFLPVGDSICEASERPPYLACFDGRYFEDLLPVSARPPNQCAITISDVPVSVTALLLTTGTRNLNWYCT